MDISSLNSYYNSLNDTASSGNALGNLSDSDLSKASEDELMEVCKEFESYFLEQVFKGMQKPEVEESPTEKGVSFTTEEPLPLSTTQATGPAPSAPPAAEPSSTPPPETERESGVAWERDIEKDRELEIGRAHV